jgi:hypothetical protein
VRSVFLVTTKVNPASNSPLSTISYAFTELPNVPDVVLSTVVEALAEILPQTKASYSPWLYG